MLLHHRIKQAREDANLTQVAAAKEMGMARQTYLDLETGKTEPKLYTMIKFGFITGKTLNWLAYGPQDPQVESQKMRMLQDTMIDCVRQLNDIQAGQR